MKLKRTVCNRKADHISYIIFSFRTSVSGPFGKVERKNYLCMEQKPLNKKIIISKGTELLRIPADRLVYISADGNYSDVVTQDNRKTMASLQLGQIEDLIGDQLGESDNNFVRLGRGLIVNTDFVFSVDVAQQTVVLSDCKGCYHRLSASREVLVKLKAYLEAIQ